VDTDFIFLKNKLPDGNATAFPSPGTVNVLIVELPANSQTFRRYFLKSRLGNKKNFGRFSPNVPIDLNGNGVAWQPNPSANGGPGVFGNIEIAVESPTTISVTGDNNFITISQTSTSTSVPQNGLRISVESTGTPAAGFGTNLEFEIEVQPGVKKQSGLIECALTDVTATNENAKLEFTLMTAGVETPSVSPQMTLENTGYLTLTGGLQLNGATSGSVTLSAGTTPAVQAYTLPTAYPAANNYSLRSTTAGVLSWALNSSGDVVGPASATDNAVARFDTTTGKLIQNSGVIIDDSNIITGVLNITATGDIQGSSITATNRIDANGVLELYSTGLGPSVETQVFYYTATGNSLQTVNSWGTVSYITGKYTLSMRKGTDYHSMEIMILHDGTTAYMNTYSEIFTNASLATLTVDISGSNVRLRVTPTTVGSLEMVIERKLFTAI
jgi:hypothetical protein